MVVGPMPLDSAGRSSRNGRDVDPHSPQPRVELLYFPGCPNIDPARVQLQRALIEVGLPPQWTEHDVNADDAPPHTRGYGSPTILIDGRDVSGGSPAEGTACRLYPDSEMPGAPPLAAVLAALRVTLDPGADASSIIPSGLPTVA